MIVIPGSDDEQRPVMMQGNLSLGGQAVASQAPSATSAASSPGTSPGTSASATNLGTKASAPPPAGKYEAPAEAPEGEYAPFIPQAGLLELPAESEEEGFGEVGDDGVLEKDEAVAVSGTPPTPQVNMLANLIRWVAKAKKEIGSEQLPTFLEVYGITGNLSPDLKEVIAHLADITAQQSDDASAVDVWSQLLLELHGILTEGSTTLNPVVPFWNGGENELDTDETEMDEPTPQSTPMKLKLIYPGKDGTEKELTIDLSPEADKGSPPGTEATLGAA